MEDLKKMVYTLSQVKELYVMTVEHMVSVVTSAVEHLQKCIEGKEVITGIWFHDNMVGQDNFHVMTTDFLDCCLLLDPSQLGASIIMSLGVAIGILDHLITGRWRSHPNDPVSTSMYVSG